MFEAYFGNIAVVLGGDGQPQLRTWAVLVSAANDEVIKTCELQGQQKYRAQIEQMLSEEHKNLNWDSEFW